MSKKEAIIKLLTNGDNYNDIVRKVGCSKSTITYHAKKMGLSVGSKNYYDWSEVQNYFVSSGFKTLKTIEHFGMCRSSWHKAVVAGRVVRQTEEQRALALLATCKGRNTLKRCMKTLGVKQECSECKGSTWRGKPLSLQLDHINGINDDNRLSNLRLMCPNCHSQTPTFGGRNADHSRRTKSK